MRKKKNRRKKFFIWSIETISKYEKRILCEQTGGMTRPKAYLHRFVAKYIYSLKA